ncbi:potassium transporter 10-like isoform X2 [Papaver somniferum]|uniref:potassium transporter 10-like isoform X2 n=1 Tax=Papaver somniferum TaxID=3469 RepID=UPI000E703FC9|nr:potassium transporter 10-like isoform X2 [Papaver somniferum]
MEEMRDRDEINTLVLNVDLERQNINGISDDETNDDPNNIVNFNVGDLERQNLSDYSDDETKEDMIISGVREKQMTNKLSRLDSFEKDACVVSQMSNTTKVASLAAVLKLAFQSIGVVYGDIGTSVLYLFPSVFSDRVSTHNNIVGALSLIIYSLTLFPLIKYVFVVLQANDNGDGGTFALYSLISRHVKVNDIPIPSRQHRSEEMRLSANKNSKRAAKIKDFIENSSFAKTSLLILALLGTCMVIGDGILTPCISGARFFSICFISCGWSKGN